MKTKYISFLAVLTAMFLHFGAQAQKRVEMLLWDENPSDTTATKTAAIRATDFTKDPAITVYIPEKPNGKAIIMCPGGGYAYEATGHEGHDMAAWFNSLGITYVVLKYRLPQGDPALPLADAMQAIRLVREHAAEWGVDRTKVGIMGASAGGHLASTLATHHSGPDTRPDFQILFYPVITMDPSYTHMGSHDNLLGPSADKALEQRYSGELNVTPDTPKAFIMLSSDDTLVPVANSVNYYMALLKNGVSATLHAYPEGGHGWGFRDCFKYKPQWTADLEKWLREE